MSCSSFGCWLRRTCCTATCFSMHTSAPSPSLACLVVRHSPRPLQTLVTPIDPLDNVLELEYRAKKISARYLIHQAVNSSTSCDTLRMQQGRRIRRTPVSKRPRSLSTRARCGELLALWLRRFVWGLDLLAGLRSERVPEVSCLPRTRSTWIAPIRWRLHIEIRTLLKILHRFPTIRPTTTSLKRLRVVSDPEEPLCAHLSIITWQRSL